MDPTSSSDYVAADVMRISKHVKAMCGSNLDLVRSTVSGILCCLLLNGHLNCWNVKGSDDGA
jgi:hypothetical protein